MTTCLACDFGGSAVKYALVDDEANLTHSGKLEAPLDSIEQFVDTVAQLHARFPHVDGIAISIPGTIDPETGHLFGSGAYTALYGVDIAGIVRERCGVEVTVENDGKCAALSEAWVGGLVDEADGAVIILGSGLAGGLIKDGRVHHGADFSAGEISFLMIDPDDRSLMGSAFMSCGMFGMTYKMCKEKGLDLSVQDSSEIIRFLDASFHGRYAPAPEQPLPIKADGKQMFEWLAAGDPVVQRIYAEFISALAIVVHTIQISYAPTRVVIGGGLSRQERIFADLDAELGRLYAALDLPSRLQARVVRSRFLDESCVVGATYNFLHRNPQLEAV